MPSSLPPAVDAEFRALEARARRVCRRADIVEDSVDNLIAQDPLLVFDDDDPSVVRHVEELKRVARGSSPEEAVAAANAAASAVTATTADADDEDPAPSQAPDEG